nr:MAG: polyprotein 1a [Bat astrovirus]
MSGAPVTNASGRVVGVHLSNTGFTGGGAVLVPGDLHEESEVEKLRRELDELKKVKESAEAPKTPPAPPADMNQSLTSSDIVNLIREAVRVEMTVLRKELSGESESECDFEQAKGKTKRKARIAHGSKARKNKRTRAWTEEEYKRLQEQGYTREQLQDMAHGILEQMNNEEGDEYIDAGGFPKWGAIDEEDRKEIEMDWLGRNEEHDDYVRDSYRQNWKPDDIKVVFECNPKIHPQDIFDRYSLTTCYITEEDLKKIGREIEDYDQYLLVWMMRNLTSHHEWRAGVEQGKVLKELADKRLQLEEKMVKLGLFPFSQRKKKEKKNRPIKSKSEPKNPQSPPNGGQ